MDKPHRNLHAVGFLTVIQTIQYLEYGMLISLPLRQRPRVPLGWEQVSPQWTRDSVSGLCQEAKPPGPKFAEHRSRETELGKKDASNTLRTFIVIYNNLTKKHAPKILPPWENRRFSHPITPHSNPPLVKYSVKPLAIERKVSYNESVFFTDRKRNGHRRL